VGVQLAPPWLYAGILWPTCAIGLGFIAIVRSRRSGGPVLSMPVGPAGRRAVWAGLLTVTAYGLVLAALRRAPLAVVAPLRESAVVLATTWGVVRLGEARDRGEVSRRIFGAMLVLAGAGVLAIAR
jgi:glucose uptake protein GlcU